MERIHSWTKAAQADDLLLTKLIPPRLPASLVQRSALFARLDQGLESRLTLVTAPTGFGKTTLLGQWLSHAQIPAAWVTLDGSDNDPVRFWRYVVAAFRRMVESGLVGSGYEVGKNALSTLRMAQQPSFSALITSLINDLAELPSPVILVLDDLQAVTSTEVLSTLKFMIEHLPDNLHLFLLSRRPVDLQAALLRARGELNELKAADLRFSAGEIEAFLRLALPYELPAGSASRLLEKTEGWPAGVRLVTLAMQGQPSPAQAEQFIDSFNGEHHYVLDYLRKEVFEKQAEPVRRFLLLTASLDRLCALLCDAVIGGEEGLGSSQAILEQLEQANLFVTPLNPESSSGELAWYRYQPLFAEALRHEALQQLGEPTLLEIQARASRWYEQNSLLEDAVSAATAARQWDRSAQLIEQFIQERRYNELETLRRLCEPLPVEAFSQRPLLSFHYALAQLFSASRFAPETASSIDPLLKYAEDAWRRQGNLVGVGHVLAVRGTSAWWHGQLREAFDFMHRALELVSAESPAQGNVLDNSLVWRSSALLGVGQEKLLDGSLNEARSRLMEAQAVSGAAHNIHGVLAAINILGEVEFQQGALEAAEAHFRRALAEAAGGDEMLDDQSLAWLGLARIAYERNDLQQAEEYAARAKELAGSRSNEAVWVPASVILSRIAHLRGETAAALAQLQATTTLVRQQYLLNEVWIALSQIALDTGDLIASRSWHAFAEAQARDLFTADQITLKLLSSRLALAGHRPEDALAIVKTCRATAQSQGRVRSQVECLCVEALALDMQGRRDQAVQSLAAALSIAQIKGLRRIILDLGEPVIQLLREAAPNLPKRSLSVYAAALLHAHTAQADRETAGSGEGQVEPLSPQEIRVLRLMAEGRSNPEIAEALVVSVNTIKTQVQSIYRKLNINSRKEARDVARELDLV